MPVIDVSLHETSLIDAQVVLTFTHLHDLLRKVIDSNNSHQHEIDELKQLLKDERERGDRLERYIGGGMEGNKSTEKRRTVSDLDEDLSSVREQLEVLRRTIERDKHENNLLIGARFDSLEKEQTKVAGAIERESRENTQTIARHEDKITFLEKRLDSLVVPDVKSLEAAVTDYKTFKENYEGKIKTCEHFVACWDADPTRLAQLCCSRSPTSGQILSSSQQERVDYILSLPPFGECKEQFKACDEYQKSALEQRLAAAGLGEGSVHKAGSKIGAPARSGGYNSYPTGGFDSRGDLAALAGEVKSQQQAAKNALDFLDRRMKDNENLARRVTALEENAKALGLHKADVGLVQNKADVDNLATMSRQIMKLRDDVGGILEQVRGGVSSSIGSSHNQSTTGSELVPRAGTIADDLKRRVTELEVETAHLETRKADRSELQRFYQFLESVDPDAVRRKVFPNASSACPPLPVITSVASPSSPAANASISSSNASQLTPQRPHTSGGVGVAALSSSPTQHRPGTTSPNGKGGTGSPRGVFLGRSVAVVRDASCSATPASISTSAR